MISIVNYSDKYKEAVIKLILDIWAKEFDFGWLERPDIHNISEYYQKDEKSNFWVALEGGKVVGSIALQNHEEGIGYLKRMAVVSGMRRKGIGEKLLGVLLKFAKDHGYKVIFAAVDLVNEVAMKFYKKYGFSVVGVVPEGLFVVDSSVCLKLEI